MRKAKPTDSFFNFFSPPTPSSDDEEDIDEEDLEELDEKLEIDYQIGEDLKEKVMMCCLSSRIRAHTTNR